MKKPLLVIAGFLSLLGAQAQIVFDKNDLIKKDTNYTQFLIPDSSLLEIWNGANKVSLGKAEANAVYDFRSLDNIANDSSSFALKSIGGFDNSFGKAHGTSNLGINTESNARSYRETPSFTTTDFSKKDDSYSYKSVDTNDVVFGSLKNYLSYGWPGSRGRYNFQIISNFSESDASTTLLDPAKTAWSTAFNTASTAKLASVTKDAQDKVLFEEYHFHETQGNDYVRTGVGVRIDKGALATGTPNGTYTNVDAKVSPPHLVRSTHFVPDTVFIDSSVWYAEATEGLNTLNRWHFSKDTIAVNGAGVLYLPRDSFQVTQVWRKTLDITVDSITIFGNLQPIAIDTQYRSYVEYYAKGFGEPLVKITLDRDSQLLAFHYLDTINTVAFSPVKTDTIIKLYNFFKKDNQGLSKVGLTYLVDVDGIFRGQPSGVLDTLHAPYSGAQLQSSASFANGFSNRDSIHWELTVDLGRDTTLKIEGSEVTTMQVDGYGTLYLQKDTAEALRLKITTVEYETETYYHKGNIVNTDSYSSTSSSLQYWGKKAGIPLVEVDFFNDQIATNNISALSFTQIPERVFTSAKNVAQSETIALYPNPTNGQFTIALAEGKTQFVEILNLTGKSMLSQNVLGTSTIDASSWDAGIYLVKMTQPKTREVSIMKLIVE